MREDMNKYNTSYDRVPSQRTEGEFGKSAGATVRTMGGMVWKLVKTLFWVLLIAGVLVCLAVASIILSFRSVDPPNISAMKLNYSSFVYTDNDDGTSTEYMPIYSNENRVWVELFDIPDYMKTAQIAIEDHRFSQHHGVDWKGTLNAVFKLVTNSGSGGGSTLTQQLIKNVTGQNQVSILRKVKEIFTALNLEGGYTDADGVEHVGYTKEEILVAYLNVVNYGGTCQGVQAAANYYFDKDIAECSLAECALIAGITQNPSQYNPMIYPDESKDRAVVVLDRMLELSESGDLDTPLTTPITKSEHDAAVAELETMSFVGAVSDEDTSNEANQDTEKWNWYIDLMFEDVVSDLMDKYGYNYSTAVDMMYNAGFEIHSAMDVELQTDIENYFLTNTEMLPEDGEIELGFFMMDPYTGKVMAVVGNRGERDGVRLWNNATDGDGRQSGSSIKPISAYAVGLNEGVIDYGTVLKDEPIPNYFGEGSTDEGPQNYSRTYEGTMNVDRAIEQSQNAPAAWVCNTVSPEACYDWLTNSLHFTTLTEDDSHSISAMALGGQSNGVSLREMVAGYQIYANGGVYHKPITYNYVKDHDGNVILDNREEANPGEQVMSLDNATIMNKLLHRPIYGSYGTATGWMADMDVEIYGKTGTTDDNYDLWFIGGTPFCVAGIWNGYKYNQELTDSGIAKDTWKAVMQHLLDNYDWSGREWVLSDNVVQRTFCRDSGKLAGPHCLDTATGWYSTDKVPGTCNGGTDHITGKNNSPSPSTSPSPSPSVSPSPSPSPSPSVEPSAEPSEEPPSSTPSEEPTPPVSSSTEEPPVSSQPDITPEPPPGPVDEPTPDPGEGGPVQFEPAVPAG